MTNQQPPARLLRAARRPPRGANRSPRDEQRISDAHREILRGYRAIAASGQEPGKGWRAAALKALSYLGGDADRHYVTLRDYDHRRYGPFLGVSDDGEAASVVRRAAWASPKARALRGRASPLTIGVGLDAERLGGIGEVVVGPDEFTAAAKAVAVEGKYGRDPGLPARKQVTFSGVLNVKTLLEAGYLSQRVRDGAALNPAPAGEKALVDMPDDATLAQLAQKLGVAWREWWRKTG